MTGVGQDARIGDLLQRLIEDTREFAHAEVAVQQAKLRVRIDRYRAAAIFFAAAGALALAALIALLVGLILWLSPMIGALGATALVCGATIVLVAILGLVGRNQLAGGKPDA